MNVRRSLQWAGAVLTAITAVAMPRAARAQVYAEDLRLVGFWPDIALSVGGGIGVGNGLDTNVHSRLRLGALYAYEPLIINLGVSGELGALAERGAGLDLEINHFGGPWLQGGVARVTRGQTMSHAAIGFALFGVEWQHRFRGSNDNALIFLLRAPIGIWWFVSAANARQKHKQEPPVRPTRVGS